MGTTIVLKKIMIEKHHLHVVVCAQSEARGSTGEISTRAPTLLLVHLYIYLWCNLYLYSTGATSTSTSTLLVSHLDHVSNVGMILNNPFNKHLEEIKKYSQFTEQ